MLAGLRDLERIWVGVGGDGKGIFDFWGHFYCREWLGESWL